MGSWKSENAEQKKLEEDDQEEEQRLFLPDVICGAVVHNTTNTWHKHREACRCSHRIFHLGCLLVSGGFGLCPIQWLRLRCKWLPLLFYPHIPRCSRGYFLSVVWEVCFFYGNPDTWEKRLIFIQEACGNVLTAGILTYVQCQNTKKYSFQRKKDLLVKKLSINFSAVTHIRLLVCVIWGQSWILISTLAAWTDTCFHFPIAKWWLVSRKNN